MKQHNSPLLTDTGFPAPSPEHAHGQHSYERIHEPLFNNTQECQGALAAQPSEGLPLQPHVLQATYAASKVPLQLGVCTPAHA
jgi:hypothetical protein